jgi:putative two-component system response regulator
MAILDIGLPDLDGWEVLRRLRAEPRTRDLPVLVLTGMTEASAEKAAALGANEFLTKPVSTTVLARLVGDLLARARTAGPALEQQAPIDD